MADQINNTVETKIHIIYNLMNNNLMITKI